MAKYYNATNNLNLNTALGGPTLANGDEVLLTHPGPVYTGGLTMGVDLLRFHVGPQYTGNFSSPIVTQANRSATGKIQYYGRGQIFNLNLAGGTAHEFEFAPSANASGETTNGTITTLVMSGGVQRIADTVDCNAVLQTGGDLFLTATATHVTNSAIVSGGRLYTERPCNALDVLSGAVAELIETSVVAIAPSGAINIDGGTLIYAGSSPSGVLTVAKGTLDFSKLKKDITLAAGSRALPSSTIIEPKAGVVVTYPSGFNVGQGPTYVKS
jgi:hypothetical protein